MRIGVYRFEPRLWATILYILVAVAMLALGQWQLRRADEKIELLEAARTARAAAPVPVQSIDDLTDAAARYARVSVTGTVVARKDFLWDNRTHDGQAGYEVITPVRLNDGRVVLVNRGWIPPGPSRSELPDVSALDGLVPATLVGLFSRPSKGFMSGTAVVGSGDWPRLLQFFDYSAIGDALDEPVLPGLVQLQEADAPVAAPYLFEANWRAAASGPERHYSYAFQWFAMALALTGIFVAVNSKRVEERTVEDPLVESKDSSR